MLQSKQEFARLLTKGIYDIKLRESKNIALVQDELGYAIGRGGGSCIEHWRRGNIPVELLDLENLAMEIVKRGKLDQEWLEAFLFHGNHPNSTILCTRLFPPSVQKQVNKVNDMLLCENNWQNEEQQSLIRESKQKQIRNWLHGWIRSLAIPLNDWLSRLLRQRVIFLLAIILSAGIVMALTNLEASQQHFVEGWSVCATKGADVNMILVNGNLVGVNYRKHEFGCTNIDKLLWDGEPNYITFINLNGPGPGDWKFDIKYDDVIKWTSGKGKTNEKFNFGYRQTVLLLPDGPIEEVNHTHFEKEPLEGSWFVRIEADDVGLVLVNAVPAAGAYRSDFGKFGEFDISKYLYADQTNMVSIVVWNNADLYSWNIFLRKDNTIVWSDHNNGSGETGEVFSVSFEIDQNGIIIP